MGKQFATKKRTLFHDVLLLRQWYTICVVSGIERKRMLLGEKKKSNTLNNLSHTHFPLKYETLPFLGITQFLSQKKQQTYRFLERSVSKPVMYRISKKCTLNLLWSLLRLVADLLPRRLGFVPRSMYVGFVVDKVAVGEIFSRVFWFFPCQYHSTSVPYSFIHISNVTL